MKSKITRKANAKYEIYTYVWIEIDRSIDRNGWIERDRTLSLSRMLYTPILICNPQTIYLRKDNLDPAKLQNHTACIS